MSATGPTKLPPPDGTSGRPLEQLHYPGTSEAVTSRPNSDAIINMGFSRGRAIQCLRRGDSTVSGAVDGMTQHEDGDDASGGNDSASDSSLPEHPSGRGEPAYVIGRRDRLGKEEETDDRTEEVHPGNRKPSDPIRHGKKAAVSETEGSNPKAKTTASGAAKPEPTYVPEIIPGELPAHPSLNERARRAKLGKPVLEKLPPTSPDRRYEGGIPQAKHGDRMVRPSSGAIPEVMPAPGPAMDFVQAGHGHGIVRPPSGAVPETVPAPGPTMEPTNFFGIPSSIRGYEDESPERGNDAGPISDTSLPEPRMTGPHGGSIVTRPAPHPVQTLRGANIDVGLSTPSPPTTPTAGVHIPEPHGQGDLVAIQGYVPSSPTRRQQRGTIVPQQLVSGGTPLLIPDDHVIALPDGRVEDQQPTPLPQKNGHALFYRIGLSVLALVALALAVALPVALLRSREGGSAETDDLGSSGGPAFPDIPPLPRPESVRFASVVNIIQNITDTEKLADESSPQHQAAMWLADVDETPLPEEIRNSGGSPWRILQRYILAVLYFATGGGDGIWSDDHGFLSAKHECEWNSGMKGVLCTLDDEVRAINLDENNLTGSLPAEIGALAKLDTLWLSWNNLLGPLPETMYELSQLEFMWLNGNVLTGTLNSKIGQLSTLLALWLTDNILSGELPAEMEALQQLILLNIDKNLFTGPMPNLTNEHLPSLELIDVSKNAKLNGTIPEPLPLGLETLSLSKNGFSGTLPTSVGDLPKLRILSVSSNNFNGEIPQSLMKKTSLEALDLSENMLRGSALAGMGRLTKLSMLNLYANFLTGTIPTAIGELKALTQMNTQRNKMGGTLPSEIGSLPLLESLFLGANSFEGTVPITFQNLSKLRFLSLESNRLTGDLSPVCESLDLDSLSADCLGGHREVQCPCCTICCNTDNECDFQ